MLNQKSRYNMFQFMFYLLVASFWIVMGMQKVTAAAVKVNPLDNKFNMSNSLIITNTPPQQRVNLKVSGPNTRQVYYAPGQIGRYPSFQENYGDTLIEFTGSAADPKSLENLKIEGTWSNAGTYNKKPIDIKVTYSGFVKATKGDNAAYDASIHISDSLFSGYSVAIIKDVKNIALEFIDHDSGKTINVDGDTYIGINSLNGATISSAYQTFSEGAAYDGMESLPYYVTSDTILDESKSFNGNNQLFVYGQEGFKTPTMPDDLSQLSEADIARLKTEGFVDSLGLRTFTRASALFQVRGDKLNFRMSTERQGTWNSFSSAVIWNAPPKTPTKTVTTQAGKDINKQTVRPGATLVYHVKQEVGTLGVNLLEGYSGFTISDKLPTQVSYKSARILDKNGKDITSHGKLTQKGQDVVFEFSKEYLTYVKGSEDHMQYDGESYQMEITTTANDAFGEKIDNQAGVTINKNSNKTNIVTNQEDKLIKSTIDKWVEE